MPQEPHQLLTILEAPLAHVQPLYASAHKLLGVERRVPWLDEQGAKDDLEDVGTSWWLLAVFEGRSRRRAVYGGYIGGH
jgi:hypothetical protein